MCQLDLKLAKSWVLPGDKVEDLAVCGFKPDTAESLQAVGILAQLEGMKFGRRIGSVLPLVAACLHKGVRSMQQEEAGAGEGDEAVLQGWQEVYACLLLLERLATGLPTQVCCIIPIVQKTLE